jgi:hypothetical protein
MADARSAVIQSRPAGRRSASGRGGHPAIVDQHKAVELEAPAEYLQGARIGTVGTL